MHPRPFVPWLACTCTHAHTHISIHLSPFRFFFLKKKGKGGRRSRGKVKAAAKVKLGIDDISSVLLDVAEKKAQADAKNLTVEAEKVAKAEAAGAGSSSDGRGAAAAAASAAAASAASAAAASAAAAAAAAAAGGGEGGSGGSSSGNGKRNIVRGRKSSNPIRAQLARAKLKKRTSDEALFCDEHPAVHRIKYKLETVKHVYFHFCYGTDGMMRQTVDVSESRCPWCRLKCMSLIGLLHHLTTCHDRCVYQVKRDEIGSVDITAMPNKSAADASSEGLATRIDQEWGVTKVLQLYENEDMELEDVLAEDLWVNPDDEEVAPKPKKLSKKAIKEREAKAAEAKATGTKTANANRKYFHSRTFLPMDDPMSDEDSEVETTDFDIMFEERNKLLHEFDDVNDGEKWMMKLWNEFVMQRPGIPLMQKGAFDACREFTKLYASEVNAMKLRKNFVLHITNLHSFGLLEPEQMHEVLGIYNAAVE